MTNLLQNIQESQLLRLQKLIASLRRVIQGQAIELASAKQRIADLEEELKTAVSMAIYDPLTGAVTRGEMERELQFHIAALKRSREFKKLGNSQTTEIEEFCILFFDLNGLKAVNDTFGHAAGDILLQTFGEALRSFFQRETDIVCRWGGDEFIVFLSGVPSPETAQNRADDFLKELSEVALQLPFKATPHGALHQVAIAAAVGVSSTTSCPLVMESLIGNADVAMYNHKKQQRLG